MIPKPPERVVTIRDAATLTDVVAEMREREAIAVDTEFLRERTYYAQLCLVQIADADTVALIDVLAIDDLSALAELFDDASVLKIFHAAEQDLEILYQRFGRLPAPLFDTQLAAALVGFDDQMGYARLIEALLDVRLSKTHTRTDWSARPLPDGALAYAADDVRYLYVAYRALCERLVERGRAGWLDADFDRMTDPARFDIDPDAAWQRLRQWHRLRPGQQQALAELASWRERRAMHADRPRKWILADDALMEIAKRRPADEHALAAIHALPDKAAHRYSTALLACVERARERPNVPLADNGGPPSNEDKRLIRAGMDRLTERAEANDIAAAALASRREIAALVAGARDARLLQGWRAEAAGRAVLEAIERAQAEHGEHE